MHTVAEEQSIDRFRQSLKKTIDGFRPSKDFWMKPRVLFYAYIVLARNRMTIRSIRKVMARCDSQCAGKCQAQIYEHASQIRDYLSRLGQIVPDERPFGHIKAQVESMLYDWDDITEDAYIGKDPEIRKLIGRLADRL